MTLNEMLLVLASITAAGVSVSLFALAFVQVRAMREVFQMRATQIASESELKTTRTLLRMILSYMVSSERITRMSADDAADMEVSAADPLYQAMLDYFNRDELEVMAANVGLDIEYVPDGPLPNVALQLKRLAERTGKRAALVAAMQAARPGLLKELR